MHRSRKKPTLQPQINTHHPHESHQKLDETALGFVSSKHWRIRLVAYGARLERGLGSRPQGFKSPILRVSPQTLDFPGL